MYLRCCRTKNPCNSKYSRTIVSLTAAILLTAARSAECGRGRVGPCGWFWAGGLDRGLGQHFFDQIERHRLSEGDLADFVDEHELNDPLAHLFVVAHCLEELFPLRRIQL